MVQGAGRNEKIEKPGVVMIRFKQKQMRRNIQYF